MTDVKILEEDDDVIDISPLPSMNENALDPAEVVIANMPSLLLSRKRENL